MRFYRSLMACLFISSFFGATIVVAQSPDRAALIREIESLRNQLKAHEDALLEPSTEDRASFAELLRQTDTGLIRLLPREEYDSKNRITIRGGAYYSFTRLTHDYGYGSDISLEMGNLSVGFAGADYGMLANLGAVPLDSVTLEMPGVSVLASYMPPTSEPKARVEQRRSANGVKMESLLYKRNIPAVVGNTYILRSIDYGNSDVLVAFQVFRKDADGSLILAWKMLKKYPAPQLEREQKMKVGSM